MIFAIASFAQSNVHIKFMGIPVTGTIAQFQAKLVAKGCTYNKVPVHLFLMEQEHSTALLSEIK